jgi:hypothetical protein
VYWGLLFFVLIAFEKVTGFGKWIERIPVASNIYMLICVLIGWVLFRADGVMHAWDYLIAMFGLHSNPVFGIDTLRIGLEYWVTWVIGIIVCIPISSVFMKSRFSKSTPVKAFLWVCVGFIFLLSLVLMYTADATPFIYFAF